MEEVGPWACHSESTRQSHGMAMCVWEGAGNASPMEEPGPWAGQSESTRQSNGMAIGGANTRPMEGLCPCDGKSESTKECHGMDKGNEHLHGRAWAMGWPIRKVQINAMAWPWVVANEGPME